MGRQGRRAAWVQGCSVAALAAAMASWAGASQAAPVVQDRSASSQQAVQIDEVVVTAARRAGRLQDTSLAVTSLGEEALTNAGITDPKGLETSVPSLNFSTSGASQFVYLRGVGSAVFGVFSDNSVATYIDGVYIPRQTSANQAFNDIERVEVLRGPQATLYGRNATGGAILISSRAPSRTLEGSADVQFGNYDAQRYRLALSGPLTDALAGRLSIVRASHEGYNTNLVDGSKFNSLDLWGVRGALLWDLSDSTAVTVRANWSRDEGSAGSIKAIDPASPQFSVLGAPFSADPRRSYHNVADATPQETYGASVRFETELPSSRLTFISAYNRYDLGPVVQDIDDSSAALLELRNDVSSTKAYYNDLLLTSDFENSRWDWMAGATYSREETASDTNYRIPARSPLPFGPRFPDASSVNVYGATATAYAGFVQFGYAFAPDWKLVAGVRYSSERKRGVNAAVSTIAFPLPIGRVVSSLNSANTETWEDWSPKVGLEYRPTGNILIFANATKGFKSGAFDPQNVAIVAEPETLWNYEAGLKSEWLDHRVRLNLSVFHYDYTDIQVFQGFVDPATSALRTFLTNAASAKVDGLEIEALARPIPRLEVGFNATLLNGRYGDDSVLADVSNSSSVLQDVSGNRMIQSPRSSTNLFARYEVPIGSVGDVSLYGEWFRQSRKFFTAFEDRSMSSAGYDVFNARATFMPTNAAWTVALYGRNLGDELITNHMTRTPPVSTGVVYGAPRTFGIELGVNF